ncbi:Penicillin-binding protein 1A (fragment) [Candidatus Desulfosporosinus infrequens]|uniref:Penicillin-binding protein 1A n=1 Tax=Candidatus Desulfosporosinus infrequens TaxID=2043169 RepID=A0A2U3LUQ9_9FIRM
MYINKAYSKQQILEFYVNNCYFGEGCYGIEDAAQHYFSKPASDLTLAESATLCGVSNNPTLFSPTKNPKNSTARRNIVLNSMLVQNKITQAQYNEAKNEALTLNIKESVVTPENYMTSYAIDCVVREMMQQDAFKFQFIFASDDARKSYESQYQEEYLKFDKQVRSGGYQIYTSLNTSKQTELQNDVDSNLASFTDVDPKTNKYKMQGAAVSIDNQTGYIVAIVGGRGTSDIFNRAFLSFRQPGSSIKPVLDYAPAFDKGFHPLSQINDSYIENGPVNDTHSYQGSVTIRYATEVSINTVAFKVLENVNPVVGLNYLAKMQYSGIYPEDNTPIAAIGGFTSGVTPVEQAGGYFTLENHGYYEQPSCVKQVKYINSQVIYANPRTGVQVYTPESAYMMTDVLKGVISSDDGTGAALKISGQIVAGKTGSTDQSKDGWFCGYSKYYTTAVWCGYDIPEPIPSLYGNSYPGHIWLDYMTAIHRDLPQLDFDKPAGIVLKNIDDNGNMVSYDSGLQDMFSQPLLDKSAEGHKKRP